MLPFCLSIGESGPKTPMEGSQSHSGHPTPKDRNSNGCGSKLNHQGTAGFSHSPWFHLPGLHFEYLSTHTQNPSQDGKGPQMKYEGIMHDRRIGGTDRESYAGIPELRVPKNSPRMDQCPELGYPIGFPPAGSFEAPQDQPP